MNEGGREREERREGGMLEDGREGGGRMEREKSVLERKGNVLCFGDVDEGAKRNGSIESEGNDCFLKRCEAPRFFDFENRARDWIPDQPFAPTIR